MLSLIFRSACALVAATILASLSLSAQTLSVFDVDASAFPTMKARFFAFGADGKPIQNAISPQDIVLRENGASRTITGVTCPPPTGLEPISAVLTLDISGSMASGRGKYSNLQLAQQASSAFVRALALPPSEAAVSSFNHESYINQDFTASRDALLGAIAAFQAGGGTSYMNGLLTEPTGSIPIARNGRNKRVVVFLTDGLSDGDENAVVSAALQNKVEIYSVAVGLSAPPFIKNIARRTGGVCFENVNDFLRITQVYQAIVQLAQGRTPCEFTWLGEAVCDTRTGSITARLSTSPDSSAVSADYDVPQQAVARLSVTPFSVRFYGVPPGSVRDTVITIRAENVPFTVTNILNTSTNAAFTVTPTNFTLQAGESRQLTLRFQPRDSSMTFARFEVKTNSCSVLLYAGGGIPLAPVTLPTLRITSPNGGEVFPADADTVITWEGVLPTDTVRLQYSIDSGRTWRTITDTATGLKYLWRNIPNTPSSQCLLKVLGNPYTFKQIELIKHKSEISHVAWSLDNSLIASVSERDIGQSVIIWDANTGKDLQTIAIPKASRSSFSPDRKLLAVCTVDEGLYIYNVQIGKQVLNSPLPYYSFALFSSDGKFILTQKNITELVLLDTKTFQEVKNYKNPTGKIYSAVFSKDNTLIIAGDYYGIVVIWDAMTTDIIKTIPVPIYFNDAIHKVAINIDNRRLLAMTFGQIATMVDIGLGQVIRNIPDTATVINPGWIHDWDIREGEFSSDGTKVVVTSTPDLNGTNSGVYVCDAQTGKVEQTFYRDFAPGNKIAKMAMFSPDNTRLAVVNHQTIVTILPIAIGYAQVSTSASVWSIVAPRLAVSTNSTTLIDMGAALVGAQKDSVVQAFVVNSTPYPVRVDSIRFEGAQVGEFALVSGVPPFTVAPGASQAVEFRFSPRAAGLRTATIVLVTQSQTVRTAIQGMGIQPSLTQSARLMDFGRVLVGGAKDTTFTAILRNTGAVTLTLSAPRLGLPDAVQFSVQSFGAVGASGIASTFTLRPGDSAAITLRFAPTRLGRTSGQVQFRYAAQGASQGASGSFTPLTLNLFGEGVLLPLTVGPLIDMGSVVVSSFKDSTVQAFITNPNAQAVSLDAVRFDNAQSLAQAQDFSCQTALPLRILANSTVSLTFRFRPSAAGLRTAQMVIGAETQTLTATIQGNGTEPPVIRAATLQAPTLTSRVGGTVQMPLYLRNRVGPIQNGTTIVGMLSYNYSLLRPMTPTSLGTVNGLVRSIPLALTVSSPDENTPLATLTFRAALSSTPVTALTFSNLAANPPITLTSQQGSFTLIDAPPVAFSQEPSSNEPSSNAALVNDGEAVRILSIRPNPSSSGFTVRYAVPSGESVSLSVVNALSTSVFAALPRNTGLEETGETAHEITIRTDGWSAGVYAVRVQTASGLAVQRVVVIP